MDSQLDAYAFDDYLRQMRDLKMKELDLSLEYTEATTPADRIAIQNKSNALSKEMKDLKDHFPLAPRDYDVFVSGPEQALEIFERENPEPFKPGPCNHPKVSLRLRSYEDGSSQLVSQCATCGIQTRSHRKDSVADWSAVEPFDTQFVIQIQEEHSRWADARYKVFSEAMNEGSEVPKFDDSTFRQIYELENPRPHTPGECSHTSSRLTRRIYNDDNIAIVSQCEDCGHHIKTVSKKLVAHVESLPVFDETKKKNLEIAYSRWAEKLGSEWRAAYKKYKTDTQKKIWNNEIKFQDNSRFGTYYTSDEWYRTRSRILKRDSGICQACKEMAQCVHHIAYDRFGCENDLDLISLCNQCHVKVHSVQRQFGWQFRLTPLEIRTLHEDW
ncbi:HNH endonuclease [Pseudomonas rhodesiae]|uniref:HNH endonuclease n=1 Tax=Pseudomonas rhodesiae TaxID=76760 RepID=UPI001F1C999E|nr:hypothetical protein [Pseudomonas rhodesiae]